MINLWIFTLSIVLLWWLFIVAKIHAFKFKNFSKHIVKVTNFIFIFLICLTLLWYWLIIFSGGSSVIKSNTWYNAIEVNY